MQCTPQPHAPEMSSGWRASSCRRRTGCQSTSTSPKQCIFPSWCVASVRRFCRRLHHTAHPIHRSGAVRSRTSTCDVRWRRDLRRRARAGRLSLESERRRRCTHVAREGFAVRTASLSSLSVSGCIKVDWSSTIAWTGHWLEFPRLYTCLVPTGSPAFSWVAKTPRRHPDATLGGRQTAARSGLYTCAGRKDDRNWCTRVVFHAGARSAEVCTFLGKTGRDLYTHAQRHIGSGWGPTRIASRCPSTSAAAHAKSPEAPSCRRVTSPFLPVVTAL